MSLKRLNKKIGNWGEDFAVLKLQENGYKLITKNYRTKLGEIDIIASLNDTLYFIEVKTRTSIKFGFPQEAVNNKKLNKIKLVGQIFLNNFGRKYNKQAILVFSIIQANGNFDYKIIKVD